MGPHPDKNGSRILTLLQEKKYRGGTASIKKEKKNATDEQSKGSDLGNRALTMKTKHL